MAVDVDGVVPVATKVELDKLPVVIKFPPVIFPVAAIAPGVVIDPAVSTPVISVSPLMYNPDCVNTPTLDTPPTCTRANPLRPSMSMNDVPLAICVTATLANAVMLVRKLPSPMK